MFDNINDNRFMIDIFGTVLSQKKAIIEVSLVFMMQLELMGRNT